MRWCCWLMLLLLFFFLFSLFSFDSGCCSAVLTAIHQYSVRIYRKLYIEPDTFSSRVYVWFDRQIGLSTFYSVLSNRQNWENEIALVYQNTETFSMLNDTYGTDTTLSHLLSLDIPCRIHNTNIYIYIYIDVDILLCIFILFCLFSCFCCCCFRWCGVRS